MYVFRFEDEKGNGPFRNGHECAFERASAGRGGKGIAPSSMPGPLRDVDEGTAMQNYVLSKEYMPRNMVFCFTTFEQIHKYFGCRKGLKAMEKKGTFLYVYEVPKRAVKLGNTQSIFDRTEAVKVAVLKYEGK